MNWYNGMNVVDLPVNVSPWFDLGHKVTVPECSKVWETALPHRMLRVLDLKMGEFSDGEHFYGSLWITPDWRWRNMETRKFEDPPVTVEIPGPARVKHFVLTRPLTYEELRGNKDPDHPYYGYTDDMVTRRFPSCEAVCTEAARVTKMWFPRWVYLDKSKVEWR